MEEGERRGERGERRESGARRVEATLDSTSTSTNTSTSTSTVCYENRLVRVGIQPLSQPILYALP
jgi:hypothetical protein